MKALLIRAILLLTMVAPAAHAFDVCDGDSNYKIYIGNGVLNSIGDLVESMKVAQRLVGYTYEGRSISWRGAYNRSTLEGVGDVLEVVQQVIDEQAGSYGWSDFIKGLVLLDNSSTLISLIGRDAQTSLQEDLAKHIASYRRDIDFGDMVLTVAHSQGNWYALDAYSQLTTTSDRASDGGYGVYHVASPAENVAGNILDPSRDRYLINDTDFINIVPTNQKLNIVLSPSLTVGEFQSSNPTLLNFSLSDIRLRIGASFAAHAFNLYADPGYNTAAALKMGIEQSLDRLKPPLCENPPGANWLRVDHSLTLGACGDTIFGGPVEFLYYNGEWADVGLKTCDGFDPTTCTYQLYTQLSDPDVRGYVSDWVENNTNGCSPVNYVCNTVNSTATLETDPNFAPPDISEVGVLFLPEIEGTIAEECGGGIGNTIPDLYVLSKQWIEVEPPTVGGGVEWLVWP